MASRPPVATTRTLPPLATSGAVGNVPPPNAPREVAAPLGANDGAVLVDGQLLRPIDLARQNERELAPLNYTGSGTAQPTEPIAAGDVQRPREVVQAGPTPEPTRVAPPVPEGFVEPGLAAKLIVQAGPTPLPVVAEHAPVTGTPERTAAAGIGHEGSSPSPAPVQAPRRGFGRGTADQREANRIKAFEKDQRLQASHPVVVEPEPPTEAATVAAPHTARQVPDATLAHVAVAPRPVLPAGGPGAQVAQVLADRRVGAAAQRPPADLPYQPAASSTDSPSRGIPRPIDDPGKKITGGFGVAADAQYFPLDGAELLNVVWLLMDELAQRLPNDLRFSMAVTYPRAAVRVQVVVEGYPEEAGFQITRLAPPHEKTPVEIAAQHADECVFVVKAERREFTAEGDISSPPNAMRAETGQVIPRKQWVGEGAARQMADVVLGPQDS